MKICIQNIETHTKEQLEQLIALAGFTTENFARWVHVTRWEAVKTAKKITEVMNSAKWVDLGSTTQRQLTDKKAECTACIDSCSLILDTLDYRQPTIIYPLTKVQLENIYASIES